MVTKNWNLILKKKEKEKKKTITFIFQKKKIILITQKDTIWNNDIYIFPKQGEKKKHIEKIYD